MDADINNWKKWIDYVNHNYLISWYNGKTEIEESKINLDVINGYLIEDHDLCSSSKIFIDKIQLNCHFFSNTEIENDIAPREIKSITDHEKIIKYMTDLSAIIKKDVILTTDSEPNNVLVRVNTATITFNI